MKRLIAEKTENLKKSPKGNVNICSVHGKPYYYYNDSGNRRIIRKNEEALAAALCQKGYDEKVLAAAIKELEILKRFKKNYQNSIDGNECEKIYENLVEARKKHVDPIMLPDEEFIQQWENVEYERKGFRENAPVYYTDKGERVRSKSELLIAGILMKHKIPYRYEYPLYLKGTGWVHPDFTILNMHTRKEVYFEHFGLMDDDEYRDKAFQKIQAYQRNGLFTGDRFILTYETAGNPIDMRLIEQMILHYFK